MGVPDNYELPTSYNDAYHLMGDGVAVPAVSWLSKKLLQPLAKAAQAIAAAGAGWREVPPCRDPFLSDVIVPGVRGEFKQAEKAGGAS